MRATHAHVRQAMNLLALIARFVNVQLMRRGAAALTLGALLPALLSCEISNDANQASSAPIASVGQGLDTDADGLEDAWELSYFSGLSQTSTGDFDSDGMTNGEEFLNGFNPTIADALDDADGDRYPNIFEIRRSSDPNSAASTPTSNYVVDVAGGGTHTTLSAAISAATIASGGAYQIIGVAPGTYTGTSNKITLPTSKPKFLIIGREASDCAEC